MEKCDYRATDKFKDIQFCDMTTDERDEYHAAIAQRGASAALKALGLDDEYAATDIKDIRDMLKGFRVIKKNAWAAMLASAGRVIGWAIILSIAALFIRGESLKHLADRIAP